jgi:hypothetical protein
MLSELAVDTVDQVDRVFQNQKAAYRHRPAEGRRERLGWRGMVLSRSRCPYTGWAR